MVDNESSHPDAGTLRGASSREQWLRYTELALGYFGFLILVAYPVALGTTWLRLLDAFPHASTVAPATALYAVSLMPKTVVVGSTGAALLGYSLYSGMAAFLITGAFSDARLDKLIKEVYGEELARDEPRSGWRRASRKYSGYVTAIALAVLLPFVFGYGFALESLNDYVLYVLYLGASVSGGVLCAVVSVPTTLEAEREAPWWRDLVGAAILYGGILLGAVSLAGITPPSLPNIHYRDAQVEIEDGRLLTHSEGYWYVLTDKGIRAISDKAAGNELRITEPVPYASQ